MAITCKLQLTDDELEAKQLFMHSIKYYNVPIDAGEVNDIKLAVPNWFDETKYGIGQKYFRDNRFGIFYTNLTGLVMLLTEPNGLEMLRMTDKSGTALTARKRYSETILHALSWFDHKLTNDSTAWKSLHHVRRLHLHASNTATKKADGWIISKLEVLMTLFGFCGIALIRPNMFGIKKGTPTEREGYIHFWAVIAFMLGIDDDINICLRRPEVVEIFFEIQLRYVFLPLSQLEVPNFKQMVTAMVEGVSKFIPNMTYESQIFMVRRLCGVPGYQVNTDNSYTSIIKDIFTEDELLHLENVAKQRKVVAHAFSKIPIIKSVKLSKNEKCNLNSNCLIIEVNGKPLEVELNDRIGFPPDEKLVVSLFERHELQLLSNDSKFKELTLWSKFCLKFHLSIVWLNTTAIGHYINDKMLDLILYRQRCFLEQNGKKWLF